jgi:hypothetical protein
MFESMDSMFEMTGSNTKLVEDFAPELQVVEQSQRVAVDRPGSVELLLVELKHTEPSHLSPLEPSHQNVTLIHDKHGVDSDDAVLRLINLNTTSPMSSK